MNGIIIINKEKEWTSSDVVRKVKSIIKEKTGHIGTLDPNATGVLPVLIGKGTKISKYLINHDKTYIATLKLGEKTETGDIEGKIIEKKSVDDNCYNEEYVKKILSTFKGKSKQIPPIYSAIKVNGKKLYEYARNGENIEIEPREIQIYEIKLLNIDTNKNEIQYEVSCSKGTYIRKLCEDIAEKLGTVGYMKELERTRIGDFFIEKSIKINELENMVRSNEDWSKKMITIEEIFKDKEQITLDENKMEKFLNGTQIAESLENDIYRVYDNKKNFVGIGIVEYGKLKRDIIII